MRPWARDATSAPHAGPGYPRRRAAAAALRRRAGPGARGLPPRPGRGGAPRRGRRAGAGPAGAGPGAACRPSPTARWTASPCGRPIWPPARRPCPYREGGAAGRAPEPLPAGAAARVATGAPLPAGADAVVPIEDAAVADGRVALPGGVPAGRFVRDAGSDLGAGATGLEAGRPLGPAEGALLAALGVARVAVHVRPRVALLSTGAELVPPETAAPRTGADPRRQRDGPRLGVPRGRRRGHPPRHRPGRAGGPARAAGPRASRPTRW